MSLYPEESVGWKGLPGGVGHQEAIEFAPKRQNRREEALAAVRKLGAATAVDVAELVGRHWFHVAPRLSELLALGQLQKDEAKGVSAFGRKATRYRVSTPEELSLFLARKAVADEKGPGNV